MQAFDSFGNPRGDVTGDSAITIDGNPCADASCSSQSAGSHSIVALFETARDTATLHVVPAALSSITISPKVSTKTAGAAETYTTQGFDAYGNSRGDVTEDTTFAIAGGDCTANSCSSTTAGDHTVTATDGTATDAATLTVTPEAVNNIAVAPKNATKSPGEGQAYTATGTDIFGNTIGDVTASTTFAIAGGTCSANVCSATTAGDHIVTGTNGPASDTATLTVVAGAIAHVTLEASPATVNESPAPGNTSTLTARVTDASGNIISGAPISFAITQNQSGLGLSTPLSPTLVADGLTTDSSGQATATYTAGYLPGTDKVSVTVGTATAEVPIIVNPAPCAVAPSAPVCATPAASASAPVQKPATQLPAAPVASPAAPAAPAAPVQPGDLKL